MQCRDVRELADSFLSEQLLVETNHELVRHLETCPDCRADIAARRALRDRLRAAFTHADDLRPRPELAAELLTKLRPRPTAISRRSLLQSWWAIAAGRRPRRRRRRGRARLAVAIAAGRSGAPGGRRPPELRGEIQSRRAPDPARRSRPALRSAVRRASHIRHICARRTTGDLGAARMRLSGSPLRSRGLSVPRRNRLAAGHRRRAARGSASSSRTTEGSKWLRFRRDDSSAS